MRPSERLLGDPPLVWNVIAPEELELYEAARAETTKGGVRIVRGFLRQGVEEGSGIVLYRS